MTELPTAITTGYFTGNVADLLEGVTSDAVGYVYLTPLAYWLPMPGETPGTITSVKPVKADIVGGEFVAELLAMKWEARFYIDGILHRPDPLIVEVLAGETVDAVDIVTAQGDTLQVETRTVPLASVALRTYVDEQDAQLAASIDALGDTVDDHDAELTGRLSDVSLSATIGAATRTIARAIGCAFLGDSITSYNATGGNAWHKIMAAATGQRIRHRGTYAAGGYTLAQIESTLLPQVLALDPLPGACVVAGGTNDVGDAGYNAAASHATLVSIIDTLIGAGIMPVLWTLPPRDDSTTINANVQRWNVWVRYLAHAYGLPLVDAHRALTDPTDGLYLADLRLDDVHPNVGGHYAIGMLAAADDAFVRRFPDGTPHLADNIIDPTAMRNNAGANLFTLGTYSTGYPNGFSGFGPAGTVFVGSIITDDAIPGNWYRMAKSAGQAGSGGIQMDLTTGWAVGDRLALATKFRISSDDNGTDFTGNINIQMRASGVSTVSAPAFSGGGTFEGIGYVEYVIPAGTDTVRISATVAGTPAADSYFDIAQVTLINLTALGIA